MREGYNWNLTFKKDVKLDDDEINTQLDQKVPLQVKQHYWGSLIKLNSTYLESTDVVYANRGWSTMFAIPMFPTFFGTTIFLIYLLITQMNHADKPFEISDYTAAFICILIGFIGTFFMAFVASVDMFRLTHMPVRLNRKTRMIHVMRHDESVLTVPWDEAFFNIGYGRYKGAFQRHFIAGHKMQDLKHWVEESFVLGGHADTLENTYSLWEFFRRYMEEGPESALKDIKEVVCLPIDRLKETFSVSWTVVNFHSGSPNRLLLPIVGPFLLFETFARWLAMRTCRVPQWPEGIEEMCTIEPDDPHVYDVTTNPLKLRFGYTPKSEA